VNVLIYASKEDTLHKHLGQLNLRDRAYWTVNGTPRKCGTGDHIFFHDGEMVYAKGRITEVEEGKIWFTPLERYKGYAEEPPTQGFKYIEGQPVPPCVICGEPAEKQRSSSFAIKFYCEEHYPSEGPVEEEVRQLDG
jgi:hypothetical protein